MEQNQTGKDSGLGTLILSFLVCFVAISLILPIWNSRESSGGKIPATKAKMVNLKSALLIYNSDFGFFPFEGDQYSPAAFDRANRVVLGLDQSKNVLFSGRYPGNFLIEAKGCDETKYQKRWKGPYLDYTVDEFFLDSYDSQIFYTVFNNTIYLQSAGPDRNMHPIESVLTEGYQGDDILIEVAKVKNLVTSP
ncbi:MAG: hypothetical protein ACOYXC_01785 [Candidatus Rifleibacteriota bacterium]